MTAAIVVAPAPAELSPAEADAAVHRLCRQMREVCASAVDPLEIAAALEAEAGLTGPMLRARYGCPDVFTLADEMYRRTAAGRRSRRRPPTCGRPTPGRTSATRCSSACRPRRTRWPRRC